MKLPTVSTSKQQQQQQEEAPSSMLRVAAWTAAAAVFLALAVYAMSSSGGTAITYILCSQRPGTSASSSGSGSSSEVTGLIPTLGWNPMQLPLEYHEWIHDQVRFKVPTMVSDTRRQLTMELATGALLKGIPGDFVETGVALGGTTILLLKVLDQWDHGGARVLWGADSFDGLPDPVEQDLDGELIKGRRGAINVTETRFKRQLSNFDVPTERLNILKGWFNETLPVAPIGRISLLRLDGDLYTSTRDALQALYHKVSLGGFIYIDDYGSYNGCKKAVDEFRAAHSITAPLQFQYVGDKGYNKSAAESRWEAVWWIKTEADAIVDGESAGGDAESHMQ